MSVVTKHMSSTAHKKALWTVNNVRGQNDEENWGMLRESGSSSGSECILRSTLAILPCQRAAGYSKDNAHPVPLIEIIPINIASAVMTSEYAVFSGLQRRDILVTSALSSCEFIEVSALNV